MSATNDAGSSLESELRKQIEEKDDILASLKEKTKTYIQKLQRDSTQNLEIEKENVKQLQGKVEAAKKFITKQREQNQDLSTANEALQKAIENLQAERDSLKTKLDETNAQTKMNNTEITGLRSELSAGSETVSSLRDEVSQLESQLEDQKRVAASESNSASAEAAVRVQSLEEQLEQSSAECDRLRGELSAGSETVSSLRDEVSQLESQLEDQKRVAASESNSASAEAAVRVQSLEEQLDQCTVRVAELLADNADLLESKVVLERENISLSVRLDKAKVFFQTKKADEDAVFSDLREAIEAKEHAFVKAESLEHMIEDLKEENTSLLKFRAVFSEEKAKLSVDLESALAKAKDNWETVQNYTTKCTTLEALNESVNDECTSLKLELEKVSSQAAKDVQEHHDTVSTLRGELKKFTAQIEDLKILLRDKSELLETCESQVKERSAQCTLLLGQVKSCQSEIATLNSNLESEILQNQDRKKKIRVYVDKLTSDKTSLQQQLDSKKADIIALTEERSNVYDQLVEANGRVKEFQELHEKESSELNSEIERCNQKILSQQTDNAQEVAMLHERISVFEKQQTDTLLQTEVKILQSNQELTEHKSKRIAARSELIGLAQAMERAQQECSFIQDFIAHTLIPIAIEQVTGLESAVRSVEGATSSIHKKKSMLMLKHASKYMSQSYTVDDVALDVSSHTISKSMEESDFPEISKSQKYMEKVKHLESEMERVRAGVKLLGRSVERLNEAVIYDSRCCGGIYDILSSSMGSCFEFLRPSGVTNVYTTVLDDSEHDGSVSDHVQSPSDTVAL